MAALDQLETEKTQTIALCMIVKNEAKVIERAFDSVRHFVDYYCICDTGSTDGTQQIIKDYLKKYGLSGEVHDRDWVDFSHNRNEAFELGSGKCDYIMTLDADEVVAPVRNGNPDLEKVITELPKFQADRIEVQTCYAGIYYNRTQFFKDGLSWKWNWPVHEVCSSEEEKSAELLRDAYVLPTTEGNRATDPSRYKRDALIFENWVIDHPEDARGWFYLAQSYRDATEPLKGVEPLEKVIEFSVWPEEIYLSHLRLGRYKLEGGLPFKEAMPHFFDAYNARPYRAEPLHHILSYFRANDQFHSGILIGEKALSIQYPSDDILFVERHTYDWRIKDELSICYFWTGRYQEAHDLQLDILTNKKAVISEEERKRIKKNMGYAKEKLTGKNPRKKVKPSIIRHE